MSDTPENVLPPFDETRLITCESEPIHIPGRIQAHGILIALRASDFTILQVSKNVFDHLGIHATELLHQPLSKLMRIEPVETASRRLGEKTPRLLNPIPLEFEVNGKLHSFDGILHRSGRVLILELEDHLQTQNQNSLQNKFSGIGGFYESVRDSISKITNSDNLREIFELTCDEVRRLTGFSRVLIYKFDDDWNGTVIAESREAAVASLMHHRFPASDIPKQARDLYTLNWLRLIPNVNYVPSELVPTNNPITDKPLDLSNSVLRSVSPVHLEYMRNMGQAASMSVSLLKGRKLWGLISCHNPAPLYLRYDTRVTCEFVGQMVSSQILMREENAEIDYKLQLKSLYTSLLSRGGANEDLLTTLEANSSSLLALTEAQGVALCLGTKCICIGTTPAMADVIKIRDWFKQRDEPIFTTDSLSAQWSDAGRFIGVASGLLAIAIPKEDPGYILWFRPELKEEIPWGGNPHAAKSRDPHTGILHPRKSFATWLEIASGKSKKWTQTEVDAADEFRTSLMGVVIRHETDQRRETKNFEFLNSLTNSLEQSAATKDLREPKKSEIEIARDARDVAQNSKLLLEGFAEFAVLFLDNDGLIQSWSAGAHRLLGYAQTDAVGHTLNLFLGENEIIKDKHARILEQVRSHQRCEEELWLYRRDRSSFWGKIMVAKVATAANTVIGFSIVIQDVTKEKAAEEELKATKLAAEAANRAKSAFLANISHEIRTPLGAILGFAELMSDPNQNPDEKEKLYAHVQRNGAQLTNLINDLLDLTKVESGRLEVEKIPVDLPNFLRDVLWTMQNKASEKSLEFSIEARGRLPMEITTDPTRLRQILINLLGNSIKFTNRGGVKLICSIEFDEQGSPRLAMRVTDTGRGMTEDEMKRLFQPFVQADVSTTRMYGGTGLGLFVSQRLARALGGSLRIESSTPNEGTTFLATIDPGTLSMDKSFTELLNVPEKIDQAPGPEPRLDRLEILVVDDSADNRQLLEVFLRKAGGLVTTAENGEQGVQKALNGKFDIVLMDIQMPTMDGNRAMQLLRAALYQTPVIALTAHAMKEEREQSLALGFKSYLTKPIHRLALIQTIVRLTSDRA